MTVDLLHNKIIKETVTDRFSECINTNLCPKLQGIFGDSLLGIQMYEDYVNDGFVENGYIYYPMTVVLSEGCETVWVMWDVSDPSLFKDGNPYAFLGESLDFIIAEEVPSRFKDALVGRAKFFEGGYVKLNVQTNAPDITMLAGKYSQSFIDEMNRQISNAICRACGISGLDTSTVEIDIVFAPETYMEHTSENVTYRRLLMSAKGCAARDFWIKWTRLNSSVAYSVNDNVDGSDIVFEIGEDVSHKIREKEYRFLVYGNSEKYRVAMGRKNITEWRELIKRALKRGELTKTMSELEKGDHAAEVSDKLSEILAKCGVAVPTYSEDNVIDTAAITNDALLSALGAEAEDVEQTPEFNLPDGLTLSLADIECVDVVSGENSVVLVEPSAEEILDTVIGETHFETDAEELDASAEDTEFMQGVSDEERSLLDDERIAVAEEKRRIAEERAALEELKRKYEEEQGAIELMRLRLEEESRARKLAEAEAERLRREQEELLAENKLLEEKTKLAEEVREREEQARREQENKLREQLELEAREKAREKLLFAEAARLAREEHERIMAERDEAEAIRRAEEARAEELRRIEVQRAAEEDRIRSERERIAREAAMRIEESNRRRAEIEERAIRARAMMEAEARANADNRAAGSDDYARVQPLAPPSQTAFSAATASNTAYASVCAPSPVSNYNYTSKLVRLMFRRNIDPNVTARIHEMISLALSHFGKESVYIKVKASIPDQSTVILNFVKIPEEELDLLVDIIKFLGNSDLGIYKVILE